MTSDLLAGRYRRLSALGQGAMGDVWRAHDDVLDRDVAIKQLRLGVTDAAAMQRIEREARVAAGLRHRGIVAVHDLLTVDGVPYVIMELVDGRSLADHLRVHGPLSVAEARRHFAVLADALAAAHRQGVVHRDVKPGNVLFDADGAVKLADFGIARSRGDAALTETGHMIGTVAYMPPEIAHGAAATPASDVWSLGATLYAALEGRAPFDGAASTASMLLRLVSEDVPAARRAGELGALLATMVARDPEERPSAAAVADALGAGPSVHAEPATRVRSAAVAGPVVTADTRPEQMAAGRSSSRGLPWLIGAAGAVVVAAVVAAVLIATRSDGSRTVAAPATPSSSSAPLAPPVPATVERTVTASATATVTQAALQSSPARMSGSGGGGIVSTPVSPPSGDAPYGAIVIYSSVDEYAADAQTTAQSIASRLQSRGIDAEVHLTDGIVNLRPGYYIVYSAETTLNDAKDGLDDLRDRSGVRAAYAKCAGTTQC